MKGMFLLVRNLPRLQADQVYEVWRIAGDVPSSAGTFGRGDDADQFVTLSVDFSTADAVGVSIEPKGGSPTRKPTGTIVLLGLL